MRCEHEKEGLKCFLKDLRNYNSEIGDYQVHALDPSDFNYAIKLSNGIIRISWEELQLRYELHSEIKQKIATRFRKNEIN